MERVKLLSLDLEMRMRVLDGYYCDTISEFFLLYRLAWDHIFSVLLRS